MAALPPPTTLDDHKLLVVATNSIDSIVTAAAIARQADAGQKVTRIFLDTPELGALPAIPAYRQGAARTVVLDFPTPLLARQPGEALSLLRIALDLTWVSGHEIDADALDGLTRCAAVTAAGALWPAVSSVLDLAGELPSLYVDILADLPGSLPDPDAATPGQRWRYALEAARQEPLHLGPRSQSLVDLAAAEPELVETGHELLVARRDLALSSSFHSFPVASGETGVIVVAPQWGLGYYSDMVEDLRRAKRHAVSILAFDSQEPVIVEYSSKPPEPEATAVRLRATFPDHLVRPWRGQGFVIKGPATNDVTLLDKLIDILRTTP